METKSPDNGGGARMLVENIQPPMAGGRTLAAGGVDDTGKSNATRTERQTLEDAEREVETRGKMLGVIVDYGRGLLVPLPETLAVVARRVGIPMLPTTWALRSLIFLYYPLVIGLGLGYGAAIRQWLDWEGAWQWAVCVVVAMAFMTGSLTVCLLWKRAAIAKYRVPWRGWISFEIRAGLATVVFLIIDYWASVALLKSAVDQMSLGANNSIPEFVVWLLAGLTTFAQAVGALLGYALGTRHEVETIWWKDTNTSKAAPDLKNLWAAIERVKRLRQDRKEEERRPLAHNSRDTESHEG